MRLRSIILVVLLAWLLSVNAGAETITITNPIKDTFLLTNIGVDPHSGLPLVATDLHIHEIDVGNGGKLMDVANSIGGPFTTATGGSNTDLTDDITFSGGGVVPVGGTMNLSFTGWYVGTSFEILFSYNVGGVIIEQEPMVVEISPADGGALITASAIPEPSTLAWIPMEGKPANKSA